MVWVTSQKMKWRWDNGAEYKSNHHEGRKCPINKSRLFALNGLNHDTDSSRVQRSLCVWGTHMDAYKPLDSSVWGVGPRMRMLIKSY